MTLVPDISTPARTHNRFVAGSIPAGPTNRSLESCMTAKSILCIRHGESTFNAAWRAAGVDPLHFDASLSEIGLEQVRQARATLADFPVELVITSPLTRALQTAAGLFADHPRSPRMMVVALPRERVENSCDVGRSPIELAADFPSLDFAHLGGSLVARRWRARCARDLYRARCRGRGAREGIQAISCSTRRALHRGGRPWDFFLSSHRQIIGQLRDGRTRSRRLRK